MPKLTSGREHPMGTLQICFAVVVLVTCGCPKRELAEPEAKPRVQGAASETSAQVFRTKPAAQEDMLQILRKGVESELGQPVVIDVDELRKDERWAFVTAVPLAPDGNRIDYSETKFAPDLEDGTFDDWLCALLENDGRGWRILALELGATDVPFVDWPERFGVPKTIVFSEKELE